MAARVQVEIRFVGNCQGKDECIVFVYMIHESYEVDLDFYAPKLQTKTIIYDASHATKKIYGLVINCYAVTKCLL